MKLQVITLVLDGMPWLPCIFTVLNRLSIPWHWHVVEGAANNGGSTRWCRPQEPRCSRDGTLEFLGALHHPNVSIYHSTLWDSKDQMVNHPLHFITEPCVLMQIDSDEIWQTYELQSIVAFFGMRPSVQRMAFECRYFVGPHLAIVPESDPNRGQWLRAWRFTPGMRFDRHEPPALAGNKGEILLGPDTAKIGLIFDHYAWATEAQVRYKEKFYGYTGALRGWRSLQIQGLWPVKLSPDFFPWMDPRVMAAPIA